MSWPRCAHAGGRAMIARFVRHGTGSAAAAADYLLADRDHAGEKRDQVEVLRGDPHQVAEVADTCGHQHRYRSAVLAWAPEDNPTRDQIERAVDRFQELAWAGIDADRAAWSAVLHRHQDPAKGVRYAKAQEAGRGAVKAYLGGK